jgi:hypothetical protein
MAFLRISVLGLAGVVASIALGLASLRYSTPNVARWSLSAVLLIHGLAILAAIQRRGVARAFWLGFALMGGVYLALSSGSWTLTEKEVDLYKNGFFVDFSGVHGLAMREPAPLGHWLGTTSLLDSLRIPIQLDNGTGSPPNRLEGLWVFDPRRSAMNAALDRRLEMSFPRETPLEDVLSYIKASTRSEALPDGIPIYVDPDGLTEAEKTMQSGVSLEMKDLPLWMSLPLILRQIDLTCVIDSDLVTITSRTRASVTDRVEAFRRVGHALFALLVAVFGGIASCTLRAKPEGLA